MVSPKPYGPILVPVDFSAASEAALRWAAHAAPRFEASLLVLHVVHEPAAEPGYYQEPGQTDGAEPIEVAARKKLEQFLARCRREIPEVAALTELPSALSSGLPTTRILETAQGVEARMIVMGSRGRTGLPRLLLGSQAERVARLASIPVTLVKASADAEP